MDLALRSGTADDTRRIGAALADLLRPHDMVVLTETGWQAIVAAAPDHVRSVRENLIDLLTPQQIETLGDIATAVIEHLSSGDS